MVRVAICINARVFKEWASEASSLLVVYMHMYTIPTFWDSTTSKTSTQRESHIIQGWPAYYTHTHTLIISLRYSWSIVLGWSHLHKLLESFLMHIEVGLWGRDSWWAANTWATGLVCPSSALQITVQGQWYTMYVRLAPEVDTYLQLSGTCVHTMCTYTHTCICTYMYMYTHTYLHMYMYLHVYVHKRSKSKYQSYSGTCTLQDIQKAEPPGQVSSLVN